MSVHLPEQWDRRTFTYKTVGACQIQADVYQAGSQSAQSQKASSDLSPTRPVIVWIHGGALIAGSRSVIPSYQFERYLAAGFTIVSIDYRLAPETRLPEIIADLQDAIGWVREAGPRLFSIDPQRLAVIGHSAGGYLTLMAGFCVQPPPRALVSFYGYGDIIGPWYSQPDPFYCREEPVSAQQALESVGQLPLSGSSQGNRFLFYLYCRQQGLWPEQVAGQDPHQNPAWFSRYCPIQNVSGAYPPALLIHGDQDTDVPYQQSLEMAAALQHHQVSHQLLTLEGRGHGFDGAPSAADDPQLVAVFSRIVDFLKQNTG